MKGVARGFGAVSWDVKNGDIRDMVGKIPRCKGVSSRWGLPPQRGVFVQGTPLTGLDGAPRESRDRNISGKSV